MPINSELCQLQEAAIAQVQAGENCTKVIVELMEKVSLVINKWTIPVSLVIKTINKKEDDLLNPLIASAVRKLLSYQWKIEYQKARGSAAIPLEEWLDITFIQSKKLEKEELELIPMWAYQQFDHRLARAFHNRKRFK